MSTTNHSLVGLDQCNILDLDLESPSCTRDSRGVGAPETQMSNIDLNSDEHIVTAEDPSFTNGLRGVGAPEDPGWGCEFKEDLSIPRDRPSRSQEMPADVVNNPRRRIEAHFEDIESKIIEYLATADGVEICAAWFTSTRITEQLGVMGNVGLIIGSSEKLTPGNPEYRSNWVQTLLRDLPKMVFIYTGANAKKMMHNKFMILFREDRPYAVITGSFNYTYNANMNWENILYIESDEMGEKYHEEYTRILQFCKPLDRYIRL
jgi:hypothetical protein